MTLSYGGQEDNRTALGVKSQELHAYGLSMPSTATGGDRKLFSGGLRTSAPNTLDGNKLEVEMDGLLKYFSSYKVIVYLDAPPEVSTMTNKPEVSTLGVGESIRRVNIMNDGRDVQKSYFLDDAAMENNPFYNTFAGQYVTASAESAQDAVGKYANCVVFDGMTTDRFIVSITDGVLNRTLNGCDMPSIAGIQIIGTYHAQDKVESSMTEAGGNDTITTAGGADVVIGGAGNDFVASFGDVRDGIDDADVVFGDNASVVLMDRNNDRDPEVSFATSLGFAAGVVTDSTTFNDILVTGNGNDVVVGGDGQDRINTERIDDLGKDVAQGFDVDYVPEALRSENLEKLQNMATSGLNILSLNFSYQYSELSDIQVGSKDYAGVVADDNWNNVYVRTELNPTQYPNPYDTTSFSATKSDGTTSPLNGFNMNLKALQSGGGSTQVQGDTSNGNDQIDPDSGNTRLMDGYLWTHKQEALEIKLNNIGNQDGFGTYDVYVYFDGDNEYTDTINWIYQLTAQTSSNMTQNRYANDWRGSNFSGEFREVTCEKEPANSELVDVMTPRMDMVGNYVVFRGLSGTNCTITMKNYLSGVQNPLNLPGISGIQVVGGVNREKVATNSSENMVPRSGDFDNDVVIGDNGKVAMTLDIPFGTDDQIQYAQNKVYTASSIVDSFVPNATVESQSDYISTGRNQDVVMGGNGNDAIDSGVGADVVMGDNAKLEMVDNNPIGVRVPQAMKLLDKNQDNNQYIGTPGASADTVVSRINNGQAPGVTLLSSTQGGKDIIDGGQDNDLLVGQESADAIIDNEGKQDAVVSQSDDMVLKRDGLYASEAAYLADLSSILSKLDGNDQDVLKSMVANDFGAKTLTLGEIAQGLGSAAGSSSTGTSSTSTTKTAAIALNSQQTLTANAGDVIELTTATWPTSGTVRLVLSGSGSSVPGMEITWTQASGTGAFSIQNGTTYWCGDVILTNAVSVNGVYTVRLTMKNAGSFNVQLVNW